MRTTDEIRQDILALVREYSESEQSEKQPFRPGQTNDMIGYMIKTIWEAIAKQ